MRRASAAISVAKGKKHIAVEILLLIALPAADHLRWIQIPIIGGDPILLLLDRIHGGNKMREHLAAVDAAPKEGVVRQLIILIPGNLGGHKIIDPALLHNLRQGGAVAEHIR